VLRRTPERMRRRGPDDEGTWQVEGVVLGHRRLSILDLDHRAAQPMQSICGRYVIVFNGEIYNFRTLRQDLESRGVVFRTTSNTEVILALFAAEGEAMLPKLHGMFALAI
jgi:asparagine synthase (glutamine-hydrolysing)